MSISCRLSALYILVSSMSVQMVPSTLQSGSLDQLKDLSGLEERGTSFLTTATGLGGGAEGGRGGPLPGGGGGPGGAGGGGGGAGVKEAEEVLRVTEEAVEEVSESGK